MQKLAQARQYRDEIAEHLKEATTHNRFSKTRMIGGKKYFLFTHTQGETSNLTWKNAEERGNYISNHFPYLVEIRADDRGRCLAEIWVKKK